MPWAEVHGYRWCVGPPRRGDPVGRV